MPTQTIPDISSSPHSGAHLMQGDPLGSAGQYWIRADSRDDNKREAAGLPTLVLVLKIARALGVSSADLLRETEELLPPEYLAADS